MSQSQDSKSWGQGLGSQMSTFSQSVFEKTSMEDSNLSELAALVQEIVNDQDQTWFS